MGVHGCPLYQASNQRMDAVHSFLGVHYFLVDLWAGQTEIVAERQWLEVHHVGAMLMAYRCGWALTGPQGLLQLKAGQAFDEFGL